MLDAAYAASRDDTSAGLASILVTSAHAVRALNKRPWAERIVLDGPVDGREVDLADRSRASVRPSPAFDCLLSHSRCVVEEVARHLVLELPGDRNRAIAGVAHVRRRAQEQVGRGSEVVLLLLTDEQQDRARA